MKIILAVLLLAAPALAQQPAQPVKPAAANPFAGARSTNSAMSVLLAPQTVVLSDAEQKEAAAARGAVEQANVALGQALDALAQADLSDCSRATFVSMNVQLRLSEKRSVEAQRVAILWKHRATHGCNDCAYSPDGKGMVKPDKQ